MGEEYRPIGDREGTMDRRTALKAALAFGVSATSAPLRAQTQTQATTRLLVGFQAGAGMDSLARVLAERLRSALDTVIVENQAGAGGLIAIRAVKAAAADGRTLLLTPSSPLVLSPHTTNNIGFDPLRDLAPIGRVATFTYALAVAAKTPARTLAEYVALVKREPAMGSFGTAGARLTTHFLGLIFARGAGINLVHVPYRGAAPAIEDAVSGQIPAVISTTPSLTALHERGQLRILAISDAQRDSALPDVPTFAELGFGNLVMEEWCGIFAPPGLPKSMAETLDTVLRQALADEQVRQRFAYLGFKATPQPGPALAAALKVDYDRWAEIVKTAGFTSND